ncbi:hypothetical protein [Methanobacterium spitsbergense]|nr:hypothetical protein [Methanobacterium spitsbergense]
MDPEVFDIEDAEIAWCPGCGNFSILSNLKKVLALNLKLTLLNW